MKKRIIYLGILLMSGLFTKTSAQELQWSLSDGFDYISNTEMHSHLQKSNRTYSIQMVPMIRNNHWLELKNFKLIQKTKGSDPITGNTITTITEFAQGLPLNKNIGTTTRPDYYYFPASYQIGIYFVNNDQVCALASQGGINNDAPLVYKNSDDIPSDGTSGYINNASFDYETALVFDNKTCMDFQISKLGYIPSLDNLTNTTTLVGFKDSREPKSFRYEEIEFEPEEGIRLEREGNTIKYKYKNAVIFSTELDQIQDYNIVVAVYSPFSQSIEELSLNEISCLSVDQLFGLDSNEIIRDEQWLRRTIDSYSYYMRNIWKDFYHSFDYEYSDGYEISSSTYCGCLDSGDQNENFNTACSYDIQGNLKSQRIGYYNNLGRSTQSQSLDIKTAKLWLNQTLYDSQGRAAFQSLSAPTIDNFKFLPNYDFIKSNSVLGNNNYTSSDFENGDLLSPNTVAPTPNTLGWYYSNENTDEPFQDITDRPYSRTIFSTLNPGAVKQTIGGNKINDNWKQGYSFSMPAAQEMYYVFGYDFFESNPAIASAYSGIETVLNDANKQITWLKATKSVVEDVQGNEAVVFSDTDGKTLGAARAGIPENPADEIQYEVVSLIGEQKYVDIHIPKGCGGTASFVGGSASDFKVYNLKTEEPDGNITIPGFYRIEYIGTTGLTKSHSLTYIDKTVSSSIDKIKPVVSDAVGVRYKVNYYDFSLNYYNKASMLNASLQPIGFNANSLTSLSATTSHTENLKTTFVYNSLGQLLSTTSPDEGTANFKYREDGQIRFSQNSKQQELEEFSYTNYDEFGRPVESGVSHGEFDSLNGQDTSVTGSEEQHFTEYDFLSDSNKTHLEAISHTDYHNPSFLASNVATTWNTDENGTIQSQTFYSYDPYGRVKWIVQDMEGLGVKTIDYEYDPVTSQVLKVIYQKHDSNELFVHKYSYNTTQELVQVETSTDNTVFTTHAAYTYYETGALKRVELAEGIQGIDYVYNLAGQLKAINHPNLTSDADPGQDSNDLFGMTLDYYNGDYLRNSNFSLLNSGTDQYNGNIKGMTWKTQLGAVENPFQYTYQYNRNNWLTEANFNSNGNSQAVLPEDLVLESLITTSQDAEATNSIRLIPGFETANNIEFTAKIVENTDGIFGANDYKVYDITYDANGNIQTLNRNKNTENNTNRMDLLRYEYKAEKPNQLKRVKDAVTVQTNANDIKDQVTENNYIYNSIGQLIENVDEGVQYQYNASGLVTKVLYNSNLKVEFFYNDKGFRVQKNTYAADGSTVEKTTHYVRDAAGSALAIYENGTQKELPIYGASRLGIYNKTSSTSVYQLTDHLGNVRAVIAKEANGNAAALVSATDYYPFGMPMPNRQIVGGEPYRYGYQGQEKDPETGKVAFELRMYDPRISRWLTPDPAKEFHSPYLAMGNNPVLMRDIKGDTISVSVREGFLGIFGKKVNLYYENGQYFNRNDNSLYSGRLANADGTYKGFLGKVGGALGELESQQFGNELVDAVASSPINTIIKRGSNRFYAEGRNRVIRWSPGDKSGGLDVNGNTSRSAFVGLGHELAHAFDNSPPPPVWQLSNNLTVSGREIFAGNVENLIRHEHQLPQRQFYGIENGVGVGRYNTNLHNSVHSINNPTLY